MTACTSIVKLEDETVRSALLRVRRRPSLKRTVFLQPFHFTSIRVSIDTQVSFTAGAKPEVIHKPCRVLRGLLLESVWPYHYSKALSHFPDDRTTDNRRSRLLQVTAALRS